MKLCLAAFLLLFSHSGFADESRPTPAQKRVTPEQIEEILDFESDDRELDEEIRRRLQKLDPRKDEVNEVVLLA